MGSFLEKIQVLIDVDSSKAGAALKGMHSDVDAVDKKFAGLKQSSSTIFDTMKTAAPLALAGAGTAVAGFTIKAATQFENLALSVDHFTQKTGVSSDAASRWVEVAGDLGVEADTVATAFGRVAREDASGALDKYGLSAQDTSGRFAELLGKIGAIPDENERAKAAFEVFGKSWQSLSPLLDTTEDLKGRLAEVSGQKIISAKQIGEARDFRDNLDDLNDQLENFTTWVGEKAVAAVNALIKKANEIGGPIADLAQGIKDTDDATGNFASGGLKLVADRASHFYDVTYQLTNGAYDLGDALGAVSTGAGNLGNALFGATDAEVALHQSAVVAGSSLRAAGVEEDSFGTASKGAADATDKLTASLAAQANAVKAAYDANFALLDAQDKLTAATLNASNVNGDATKSEAEKAAATRDAQKAAEDVAVALAEQKDAQFEANGVTVDAATKQANFVAALVTTAGTLDPGSPLRSNLLGLAGDINDKLPANKRVTIDVDTAQAETNLQTIITKMQNMQRTVYIDIYERTHVAGTETTKTNAAGGPISAGEWSWVGEKGKELAYFGSDAMIFSHEKSMQLAKAMGNIPGYESGTVSDDDERARLKDKQDEINQDRVRREGLIRIYMENLQRLSLASSPSGYTDVYGNQYDAYGKLIPWTSPTSSSDLFSPAGFVNPFSTPTVPESAPVRPMYTGHQSYSDVQGNTSWAVPVGKTFAEVYGNISGYGAGAPSVPELTGDSGSLFGANILSALSGNDSSVFGTTVNVTVNMPPGSDGEDVVRALKKYERRNGSVPITVF